MSYAQDPSYPAINRKQMFDQKYFETMIQFNLRLQ